MFAREWIEENKNGKPDYNKLTPIIPSKKSALDCARIGADWRSNAFYITLLRVKNGREGRF